MRPRNFQVAVSMRLGLPVLLQEKSCSLCMQIIDVYGDHAACCSVSSDRIHRHNLWTELSLPLCKRSIFSAMLTDVVLGMCLFHFGGQTRALPSMWRSLVPSPLSQRPQALRDLR